MWLLRSSKGSSPPAIVLWAVLSLFLAAGVCQARASFCCDTDSGACNPAGEAACAAMGKFTVADCEECYAIGKMKSVISMNLPPQSTCIPQVAFVKDPKRPDFLFHGQDYAETVARMSRMRGESSIEFLIEGSEGEYDRGEPRCIGTVAAYIRPTGAPPCEPLLRIRIEPSETTLTDREGHSRKNVTRSATVHVGGNNPAAAANPDSDDSADPQDAAVVTITPVNPPCGQYPAGTVINGREIHVPRGDVTVYFDISLCGWGRAVRLDGSKNTPQNP